MKKHELWADQKTCAAYIHRPLSSRIVTIYPDFKVTALELGYMPRHHDQRGCGLHFIFNGEDCDYVNTTWERPSDGLPVYTINNVDDETGCLLSMTAFCSGGRLPVTFCSLTIKNDSDHAVFCHAGAMPRVSEHDHYLTGEFDTGYEPYRPNMLQWLLCREHLFDADGMTATSADRYMRLRLLSCEGCSYRWVSRGEQKNRFEANDYYAFECNLEAGQQAVIRCAMLLGDTESYKSYDFALDETRGYWAEIQSRVKLLPNTDDMNIISMFRQSITQSLQMMQRYDGGKNPDYVYPRQGDCGRFIWVYEAVHYLTMLDRVGIFDNISEAYEMFFDNWQITDGERRGMIDNPYVRWDNTNGIMLAGLSYHLMKINDKSAFVKFKAGMDMAVEYIQYRRKPAREGEKAGLFSSGQASDWEEIGQHWTYTDAVTVRGLELMTQCYEKFEAENAPYIRSVYEDYRDVILNIIDSFAEAHRGETSYNMPHILGVEFEDCYNHCFYTDGCPYLVPLGLLDPDSELFEQMENFYREIGMLDDLHGLAGRMTNDYASTGLYGNVYYTGVPEYCWITAWLRRGERDKAEKYLRGLMKFNITSEYIVSERYCSTDPFYSPWQPNGSGSGRIAHLLLDFYGEKQQSAE